MTRAFQKFLVQGAENSSFMKQKTLKERSRRPVSLWLKNEGDRVTGGDIAEKGLHTS